MYRQHNTPLLRHVNLDDVYLFLHHNKKYNKIKKIIYFLLPVGL